MKKAIIVIVLIGLLLSVCCFRQTASAEDIIDIESAKTLVKNGVDIIKSFYNQFQWFDAVADGDTSRDIGIDNYMGWNKTTYFRPVREGFDSEGVKELVKNTFTESISDYFINSSWFYNQYLTQSDTLYYLVKYGVQENDIIGLELTDEDINNLVVNESGSAVVITYYTDPYNNEFERKIAVVFSFLKEHEQWKISNMDASEAMLQLYNKVINQSVFSINLAKLELETILRDVYRLTHIDGGAFIYFRGIPDFSEGIAGSVNKNNETFYRIDGMMGRAETWLNYTRRFATEEVSQALVKNGNYCTEANQRIYYRGRTGKVVNNLDYTLENLAAATYELVSQSADAASVKVTMRSPVLNSNAANTANIDLTVEFSRDNNKWIISGGDFIDILDDYYAPKEDNVKTGDFPVMPCLIIFVFAASCIILTIRGGRTGMVLNSISNNA